MVQHYAAAFKPVCCGVCTPNCPAHHTCMLPCALLHASCTMPLALGLTGKRSSQQQQQQQPCLWAALRYGDHVEDEWWAVWLLLELSRSLPHLFIRLWDDDGDFLLIEVSS